jgi:hypothetical protein
MWRFEWFNYSSGEGGHITLAHGDYCLPRGLLVEGERGTASCGKILIKFWHRSLQPITFIRSLLSYAADLSSDWCTASQGCSQREMRVAMWQGKCTLALCHKIIKRKNGK